MGINGLWTLLSSTSEKTNLRELRGQVVAVDLAGWIVQQNKAMNNASEYVPKPHLRNLFFRSAGLIDLGVRPIFILDGDAPELKRPTLDKRNEAEFGSKAGKSLGRRRLKGLMNECERLITALGLPCLKSQGEAEALCARLDVDAVITDDSDVFCYGDNVVVWRNFSISGKSFSVERFDSRKISQLLGLSRNRMILLGIFLGCDFFPSGIPGIGKTSVMSVFKLWPKSWCSLDIMKRWIETDFADTLMPCSKTYCSSLTRCCDECFFKTEDCRCAILRLYPELQKLENGLKKKCYKVGNEFWKQKYPEIIREFLNDSYHVPSQLPSDSCPKLQNLVDMMTAKLEWVPEYAFEKALPVLTRWLISADNREIGLELAQIRKKRIVGGIPSLEVVWKAVNPQLVEPFNEIELSTIEPTELLRRRFPEMVDDFLAPKKKPKTSKKKVAKNDIKITEFFAENKVRPESPINIPAESSDFSDEDKDLSFIIQDIVSHKVKQVSSEKGTSLITSTPSTERQKSCIEIEDSFDRMCITPNKK